MICFPMKKTPKPQPVWIRRLRFGSIQKSRNRRSAANCTNRTYLLLHTGIFSPCHSCCPALKSALPAVQCRTDARAHRGRYSDIQAKAVKGEPHQSEVPLRGQHREALPGADCFHERTPISTSWLMLPFKLTVNLEKNESKETLILNP